MEKLNGKWLLAVSGGPDSMALVTLCLEKNIDFAIAHVNYHHRLQAEEEEKYISSFCKERNIDCYIKNDEFIYSGNFESAARIYRYDFFVEIVISHNLKGVMIAHNEDDVLETYLMQKEKNLIPETYGLAKEMTYKGIAVYRPLLSYPKKDLEEICKKANIKYYFDHTNLDTTYARNDIRQNVLKDMDRTSKDKLLIEIEEKNKHLNALRTNVKTYIKDDKVCINDYRLLNSEERIILLHIFLKKYYRNDQGMSFGFKKEIDNIISKEDDFMIPLNDNVIVQDTGYFFVIKKPQSYYWTMNSINDKAPDNLPFKIAFRGEKSQSLTVKEDDFPLVIRCIQDGDEIKMRFGTKKVHRFFIDRHIPLYKRMTWPIVVNSQKEVILVPKLGPNINHYSIKPDFYVIQ